MDVHTSKLALFQPPKIESAVLQEDFIEFRPTGTLSKGSIIEFNIPGTSSEYIDLSKSRLHVKFKIIKADGSAIIADDKVGGINLTLHSLFRQVDVSLAQKIVSPDIGVNYGFKSLIDILLKYGIDEKETHLSGELYFKDISGMMEATDPVTGGNNGLLERYRLTKDGQICSCEGPLHIDIAQQKRAILNGVPINIKLFPSQDSFRLMAPEGEKYQVEITDAVYKVCHIKVSPKVIIAHNETLSMGNALYPFWKSNLKTFTIAGGSFTFSNDDFLNGIIPSKVIVGLVSSEAYAGSYTKNPYNFDNFDLNYLELSANGNSVPGRGFEPDYENGDFTTEYLSLFFGKYPSHAGNFITRQDYPHGYCLYVFNVQGEIGGDLMSKPLRGHTRLNLRFAKALASPVTVIVYSTVPSVLEIDKTKNVIL